MDSEQIDMQSMSTIIRHNINESRRLIMTISENKSLMGQIASAATCIYNSYLQGKTLLILGNGGSSADAQHIAGELVGQFYYKERPSIPALALTTDTSVITSIANDRSYDEIFSRQVEAFGDEDGTMLVLSTSGNSGNIIKAIQVATVKRMRIIGLLGNDGGAIAHMCHNAIIVPSNTTPRIQEAHVFIYHTICEIVEKAVINGPY